MYSTQLWQIHNSVPGKDRSLCSFYERLRWFQYLPVPQMCSDQTLISPKQRNWTSTQLRSNETLKYPPKQSMLWAKYPLSKTLIPLLKKFWEKIKILKNNKTTKRRRTIEHFTILSFISWVEANLKRVSIKRAKESGFKALMGKSVKAKFWVFEIQLVRLPCPLRSGQCRMTKEISLFVFLSKDEWFTRRMG